MNVSMKRQATRIYKLLCILCNIMFILYRLDGCGISEDGQKQLKTIKEIDITFDVNIHNMFRNWTGIPTNELGTLE